MDHRRRSSWFVRRSRRADRLRGRGVTDDKGPVYLVLEVVRQFLAQEGGLPLNVRFLFEGEEEIGSPHLSEFVRAHAADLAADLVDLRRRRHVAAERTVAVDRVEGPAGAGHRRHRRQS